MSEVTQILRAIEAGQQQASEELLPLVYEELRRLAEVQMSREKSGHTLQPTALVHDAYLRLVDQGQTPSWNSRGHFFSAAAEAMRRILVEKARKKGRVRHGGTLQRVPLSELDAATTGPSQDLLALDEALVRLTDEAPQKAELVKLRYFAGLTLEQAADALGISRATAARHWSYAKAWLFAALRDESPPGSESQ